MAVPALKLPSRTLLTADVEPAFLGLIIAEFARTWRHAQHLDPVIFREPRHQVIFAAIEGLASHGSAVDVPLLVSHLRETGELESVGGSMYLLDLEEAAPSHDAARVGDYVKVLVRDHARRQIAAVAEQVAQEAREGSGKQEELVGKLEELLSDVRKSSAVEWPVELSAVMKETVALIEQRKRSDRELLLTGYSDLDLRLQGLEPGQLILLGGRPSMGKTSLAMNIGENIALRGHKVGVISLEMPRAELGMRIVAKRTKITISELRGTDDLEDKWGDVTDAAAAVAELPIIFGSACDSSGASLDKVLAEIHRLVKDCGCRLVILDYLGLISPGRKMPASQTQWIGYISQQLKLTARQLNVTLLCLSQLSRSPETRGDFRPILSDLRDSGGLEQDADVVIFCYRPWYYVTDKNSEKQKGLRVVKIKGKEEGTENLCEVIVAKNRNGPTGSAWLQWQPQYCAFNDLTLNEPN